MNTELKQLLETATPRPWYIKPDRHDDCDIRILHDDKWGSVHVGKVGLINTTPKATKANAAIMAHAVNVFQELVEALEGMQEHQRKHGRTNTSVFRVAQKALQHANTITPLSSPSEENKTPTVGSREAE